MTTPGQPLPLVDPGNGLLAQIPAQLQTGVLQTAAGKAGVLTFRTSSTTLTIFLAARDVREWAGLLSGLADQMAGRLVPASAADVAAVGQQGAAFRRHAGNPGSNS